MEVTFYGVDLVHHLQQLLDSHKSEILSTAPPEAVKGYNLGIKNTLLLLEALISSLEPNEFLINTTDPIMTEYYYDELEDLVSKRFYNPERNN